MQIIELISSILLVLLIFTLMIKMWRSKSRSTKSLMTLSAGATYDLLSEDKKRAAETIIEQNAGKKMEEQSSSDPAKKERNQKAKKK